ncbi:unnamed protein product [Alopecurus aequalis]
MEAAVAPLEAAAEKIARAASAAKEAGVAASAAATDAAGAATAAALATAEQAVVASSTTKEAAMAADAAAAEMRYSKKRKFHQIDDGGRGGGDRDDGGNLDLISALPDDVIGTIISFLPTKDGARTQDIARRWLPLWRSAPLNLVVEFEAGSKNRKLIASVSKILSEHRGHARRLSLQLFNLTDVPKRGWKHKIDGWLRSQALDSLQELTFTYCSGIDMPLSVFRFAPMLYSANFRHCDFPESISTMSLNFLCLKKLTLFMVTITEDGLHSMLSGCTVLESLELRHIFGIGGLWISSQTLRSLGFSTPHQINVVIFQLVIKDAPCLERLLPLNLYGAPATIRVIRAPKLEILGVLSESISVQFGTTNFQVKMIAVSLTTKIHTIKVLVLDSVGPNLDAVVDLLKCFPCLSHPTKDMNNARMYNQLDPIECLELRLKKVVLMNYDGSKRPCVDFAKFFILNTKLLKEMEVQVLNKRNDEWMANQYRQLRMESRVSRDARIELKRSTEKSFVEVDTHDLSMADPFDIRSFY